MARILSAVFLLSCLARAADPCAIVPLGQIAGMLGTTKNKGLSNMELPPKATEGKACTYAGKDNSATIVLFKFSSPAAARDYLKTVRAGFEKQSVKTTTEAQTGDEAFSFVSGILAVKHDLWLRVNVYSSAQKIVSPDLTRQLMLDVLQAN